MRMKVFTFGMCVLLMLFSVLSRAQKPEVYPLWPSGAKESNGIKASSVKPDGRIIDNNQAELVVYHPVKDKNIGMAVIICPGGDYTCLVMRQAVELAGWLSERGITAIILKYRMPNGHADIPFTDASRAMRWVRSRAEEWNINPQKVGLLGLSAGGHLAATVATHFDLGRSKSTDRIDHYSSRPDFVVLFYPFVSISQGMVADSLRTLMLGKNYTAELVKKYSNELHVTAETPPALIFHSDDDRLVTPLQSTLFYEALKKKKVAAELHIFNSGGHGWGISEEFEYYPAWTSLLEKWLKKF